MATTFRTSAWTNSTTLRGIHMVIGWNFTQRPAVGDALFNVFSSSQYREHNLTIGAGGILEERDEGQATNYEDFNEGFLTTFTYVVYSKGRRITQRMYLNDMYGTMEKIGQDLGRSAVVTRETVLAGHFNNAFSTTGYDAATLCSVSHVREDGVTWSNKPATNSDADLSRTSLEAGLIAFRDQRDGGGKRLAIRPAILLTSADNVFEGRRILGSSHEPETDTNAINPVSEQGLDHVVWDYLSDTDAWFILADKDEHSLMCYDRIPFYSEHEYDFDTDDVKYKAVTGFSSGWSDARGVWGTSGS